jgi:hypothetical protein
VEKTDLERGAEAGEAAEVRGQHKQQEMVD